jgi:hypothetical protein
MKLWAGVMLGVIIIALFLDGAKHPTVSECILATVAIIGWYAVVWIELTLNHLIGDLRRKLDTQTHILDGNFQRLAARVRDMHREMNGDEDEYANDWKSLDE